MSSAWITKGLLLLAVARHATSATYKMSNRLTGQSFIDSFTWETKPDANWGRV